jgi:K+-transporting ATPase KdpF subunit
MRPAWRGSDAAMIEIFLGLAVAIGLGAYLVATLLRPEKF